MAVNKTEEKGGGGWETEDRRRIQYSERLKEEVNISEEHLSY